SVFLVGCRLFDCRVGVLSGLSAAVALNLFRVSVLALSDALGLLLALAAVLAALHAENRHSTWFWAGAHAGLAYLTRFPYAVLLVAFVGFAATSQDRLRAISACLTGFAIAVGPMLIWKWTVYGSPFYGVQSMHYRTMSFRASSWRWYAGPSPHPELDMPEIRAAILRNAVYFAVDLLGSPRGMHALVLGIPLALYCRGRALFRQGRALALAAAFLNFAVYASTWSLPAAQGARFMLLSFTLLLPFCAAGIVWLFDRPGLLSKSAAVVICAAAVFSWCRAYPAASRAQQFVPLEDPVARWIRKNLPKQSIVATNNPWVVSHQTGLPTAALPFNLGDKTLPKFVQKYRVRALIILKTRNNSKTLRTLRQHPEWFDETRLGDVRVLMVRPDMKTRGGLQSR
ncbi:MAG: glycosyltransferase family 39 protein, partial [Armatimonadota bacterium]